MKYSKIYHISSKNIFGLIVFKIILLCTMIKCSFENERSLILFLIIWFPWIYVKKCSYFYYWQYNFQFWSVLKEQSGWTIYNWIHTNRLAAEIRGIMVWRGCNLLRLFWFMVIVFVSILQVTYFTWSNWKCLSHVEVITTHTDTKIWHYEFIGAPFKTI